MTTQESQVECNVNIYFVVPSQLKSEDDCGEQMWLAFNKCNELSLQPEWVSEQSCSKMNPIKSDVFVIEEFKGDLFDKLKNFKCSRIVSPKCLLFCFINSEAIPEGTSPIYTVSMRNMCICASGFNSETKDWIQQRVEYMGGFFIKQLRNCVTHLVADSVMSAKYEAAIEMKIPIMTKEWIKVVWEANLKEMIRADDKSFDKYKCPVFMNLIVTSTNLPKRQKDEIKQLIHEHGGIFMGPLDGTKVRVVLASESGPVSDKLKYAMENNIPCLRTDWLYESIKIGYALPFRNFIIKSVKACSTPEKPNTRELLNYSEISSIAHDKRDNNYVDETLSSTISNFSCVPRVSCVTGKLFDVAKLHVLDRLSFNEAKSAGPFLDGCNIYLAGFITSVRDKLNRILNVGGATRLDDISDAVTHVIVGDESRASAELKVIKSSGLCPYILNVEWLEESMKLKRPASEELFLFEAKGEAKKNIETPASPLSKKNLQMLQQPKRPPVPLFNIEKELSTVNENEQSDLVQQYLQEDRSSVMQEFTKSPRTPVSEDKDQGNVSNVKSARNSEICLSNAPPSKNEETDNTVLLSQSSTVNEKLFKGLAFAVAGFDNEDNHVEETIVMLGGRLVSRSYIGIPDYGVVPVDGAPLKYTVNEIVNNFFIEDCIYQEQIVDVMYYHRPLSIRKACDPLSGCVITMSMYTGAERMYLSALATKLGAICQDMFARKANPEKNTHSSTHLVCPSPEGNKYNAAVRWKLPAVTADWLKTCADQLTLVDETPFLVGETIAPDKSNITGEMNLSSVREKGIDLAKETTPSNTPKNRLSQIKDLASIETPLINKRLSLMNTPQSPFHVSTPETPYGQVFKPNPSPNTRKGWAKWADNFPDLQVEEPPIKRRAPSTPVAELKRQLLEKLKEARSPEKKRESKKHEENSFMERIEKADDQSNKTAPSTPTSTNQKFDFSEKGSPLPNNEINMQIAQLDQVLQRTSNTPENRYSLSGENAKKYKEASDHLQKCIVKDSQPIDAIVWEDPDHPKRSLLDKLSSKDKHSDDIHEEHEEDVAKHEPERCEPPTTRKFMLSGIKEKNACEQMIKDLGGDVSAEANFDNTSTHLLCMRLSRNEKMLGSIAAGKWVLHYSYLQDSEREGEFLGEEEYEWGNPKSKDRIPEPNGEMENAIAAAAYRWRLKLQKELNDGPFSGMVALLMIAKEKYDQFKRLIEAGGGLVVQARPPYDASPSGRKITHCFVNVKQVNQPIDWAMLASKGILCFLPQYLSDYLTAVVPLNPRNCVLPEFKKYLTLLPK
ncbi:PREDICTED: DNA topoisomerase 2-binding protein 1 isoform X2 [Wasmannia auropunctata]|uniref:DNA topoisomerase 2-binding protein 1 isoform X2 n=1 Tax=Wasmannia auropunctata TaxID=64793 RepID=UPI0005F01502|nr:PREDICTED: DNA topoisomerase 2-binding protein 1 isoform X2 [Wasmannia auropunctata]